MPVRDLNKGLPKSHYLEDQQIVQKEFGDGPRNAHGERQTFTWSTRQNEWYNSERRFIFSCKNEQERKKWVTAIKLAVKSFMEQDLQKKQDNQMNQIWAVQNTIPEHDEKGGKKKKKKSGKNNFVTQKRGASRKGNFLEVKDAHI
eukprot:CAMPEP_0170550616 /NCGR_PEP_ID=MMETSP0211-20121228/8650_1 /TAXON_ID=311385 /ORGANISM="Pseudokeronopsis sp., Strain OXSARD2" /LENGTH=144 /DNA_ID=CAMNT_0010857253 /DNA_START=1471 /DNA_END=1902 /DNA_ORIENTATION=-